jgi:hypothetical protein
MEGTTMKTNWKKRNYRRRIITAILAKIDKAQTVAKLMFLLDCLADAEEL